MKTKLDIYCGILGAGKTTLIKQMLDTAYRGYKTAIIENEIGPVNLDAEELKGSPVEISKVTSGCICCTVKGSFSAAIRRLCRSAQPDYIVIEPSGAADIRSILELCGGLPEIELGRVIMIINGRKILSLLKASGPFLKEQIACARYIYISRCESLPDEQIQNISSVLGAINPEAEIVSDPLKELGPENFPEGFIPPVPQADSKAAAALSKAGNSALRAANSISETANSVSKAAISASLPAGVNSAAEGSTVAAFKIKPAVSTAFPSGLKPAEGAAASGVFMLKQRENPAASLYSQIFSYVTPGGLSEAYLKQLSGLSRSESWKNVARAKGYISTAQGRFLKVDYVFGDWSFSEKKDIAKENSDQLVFIGKDMPEAEIKEQLEQFFACRAAK